MNDARWNALFGADFFLRITNEERRYLALDPIQKDWEITQYWSKTNYYYSRVTVFGVGMRSGRSYGKKTNFIQKRKPSFFD